MIAGPQTPRPGDAALLAGLAESGAFKAVIDRRYSFADIREAHRLVDSGRKRGSVVVTVP